MQTTQQLVNIHFADRIRESRECLVQWNPNINLLSKFFSFVSHKISTQIYNAVKKNIIKFEIGLDRYNTFVTIIEIYCLIMT